MENSRESYGSTPDIVLIVIAVVFWAVGGFIAYQNGADWFLPEAASVEAESVDNLFRFMLGVGTFIFLLVETSLFYFVVRYGFMRNRDDDSDGPPIHGNNVLEIVWTIIPSIIVFVLTILSFQVLLDTTEARDNEFEINVTAQRFFWQFEYPTEDEELELTTNHILVLPEGETIRLNMSSVDVIHAFWVPQFRVKQDVMPGRTTELRFTPNQTTGLPPDFELVTLDDLEVPGPDDACPVEEEVTAPEEVDVAEAVDELTDESAAEEDSEEGGSSQPPVDYDNGFDLVCAELCGLNHGLMRGAVFVVEREVYDAFIESLRARQIANAAQGDYARRCGGAALLEAGRRLFSIDEGFQCAQCHQLEDAGVLTMGAGPSLNGIGTRAAARPGYDSPEDYLFTSIINPNAFIAEGFPSNTMPPNFADRMTPEELETMVSYLALQTEE
jgi:cytochrome c oxidase subunit 2